MDEGKDGRSKLARSGIGDCVSNEMNSATIADSNRVYFQALAHSRASLANLVAFPVLVLFLLGVVTFGFNVLSADPGREVLGHVRDVNLVLLGISAVVLMLCCFGGLLYRFQVVFSVVSAFMSLVLVYTLCSMCLVIATLVQPRGTFVPVMWFTIAGSVALLLLVGALVVHVLMLRRRLRVGHSQERTMGNYVAVSGSNRSKILWVTFGVVAVVPNVLTAGEYLANSFGALSLIFFACVLPSLPVEFGYLAYLKSKDRVYWEARPPRMPKAERRRLTRKVVLWLAGIVVAVTVFWVLAKNF